MSRRELYQLKCLTTAEANSPRKLRTRRQPTVTHNASSNVSKEYQDRVFSIPELQALITAYLTRKDLKALILTCRGWFEFCIPAIYKEVFLVNYKRYPKIRKYGQHVQVLRLHKINVHRSLYTIKHSPHLRHLHLSDARLSRSDLESVLSSTPDQLTHLRLDLYSRTTLKAWGEGSPWFPEPMLQPVTHLCNLRKLQWHARGMTVHVDDILRVLQLCPHLESLRLSQVNVVYLGSGVNGSRHERPMYKPDPHGPFEPIPEANLEALYSGRQLQELDLETVDISDESLLRLLGIDLEPGHTVTNSNISHKRISSALVHLRVASEGPTFRSGSRILQECTRLKTIDLAYSRIASLELFQGDAVWPSAPFLTSVWLIIKPLGTPLKYYFDHYLAQQEGVPWYSVTEQRQILRRFQSMVSVRILKISGYPIDLTVIEDVSFAQQIEQAYIPLTIRVFYEQFESEKEALVVRANEWVAKNPKGWSCTVNKGGLWVDSKFIVSFTKTQTAGK
ncbi:hypothetical protein CPC16_004777 [Podila verticillata]|nr:hypothetical protein CPC16_004777 [Podila verticillata]KAI9232830.1 MAG: hypothetical protein BYD32DRAFT_427415 [Podila humilis]